MANSNVKLIGILFLSILLVSCASTRSSFRIKDEGNFVTELEVTPDRVLVECLELDEDPDVGAYGFMIHMLDEVNTVTTAALNIRPDKENCEKMFRESRRIVEIGKLIYVAGRMNISKQPRVVDKVFSYTFPKHGTFYSNNRTLDFVVIANEKGQCYSPSNRENEPCPPFPFPIEKYRKDIE